VTANEELEWIAAFQARVDAGAATESRDWRFGVALVSPEMPKVWDANYLRVDALGGAGAEIVAAEATEIARDAGMAHVSIVVPDESDAAGLREGLEGLGFKATPLLALALRRRPEPPAVAITQVSFDDVAPSRRELTLEFFPGDEELADQLDMLDGRLEATIGGRWFAVRDSGDIVARAWLLQDGQVAQVEDVATTPAARGRGLGRAVVSAAALAALEAGNDLVFIVADGGGSVPEMYRKIGFEPLGVTTRFVRSLV
jgi:GNAT superfamily N-acetyltransferase